MPHPDPERCKHAPPGSSLLAGLTPEQAKAYGLIDDIIQSPDKAPVGAGAGAGAGADGKEPAGRG